MRGHTNWSTNRLHLSCAFIGTVKVRIHSLRTTADRCYAVPCLQCSQGKKSIISPVQIKHSPETNTLLQYMKPCLQNHTQRATEGTEVEITNFRNVFRVACRKYDKWSKVLRNKWTFPNSKEDKGRWCHVFGRVAVAATTATTISLRSCEWPRLLHAKNKS